jgi:hypothetical protein
VVEPITLLLSPVDKGPRDDRAYAEVHLRLRVELPGPCDIGFMLGFPRAGTDLKCAVWQTDTQAIALDIGTLASAADPASTKGSLWLNSAALYSWRHNSGFAITLNAGLSYWFRGDRFKVDLTFARGGSPALDARGPYARAGVSVETPGWFSLQPEFNVFQQINAGSRDRASSYMSS